MLTISYNKVTKLGVQQSGRALLSSSSSPHYVKLTSTHPHADRRVTTESSTGSTSSHRVHLKLTLQVDKVLYSALALSEQSSQQQAASSSSTSTSASGTSTPTSSAPAVSSGASGTSTLHISGRVTSENPHVKKGAFHTLDLEVGRDFSIIKGIGSWDSVARERIREMTEPGRGADVGAIVCGEGLASICVITNHTTIIRQRIDVPVPRKRKGGATALGADKVGRTSLSGPFVDITENRNRHHRHTLDIYNKSTPQ